MLAAAFYSLIQRFSVPIFGVLNFMLLVRIFSPDEVGTWALFTTIITLIEVAKSGFIRNASIRQLSLTDQDSEVSSASLMVNALFTIASIILIAIACACLVIFWNNRQMATLLGLFCLQLLVFIFFSHIDYHNSSNANFKTMMIAYIVRNGSLFILLAIVFFTKFKLTLELLAIAQIVCLILATIYLVSTMKTEFKLKFNGKIIGDIVHFGKYVFATNTSSMLFRSTDLYLLATLISNTSVAYYNVAMRITNLIDLPSTAASEVLFPVSIKNLKNKTSSDLKRLFERTVGYTLVLVIPMTVLSFLFAKPVILLIAGEAYLESIPILQITLLYGLLLPYLKQLGTILNVLNKPHIGFYLMLFILVFNLITNFIFIKLFGMIGAAYGTLLSYTLSILINQQILKKELNVSFANTFTYYIAAHKELFDKIRLYLKK